MLHHLDPWLEPKHKDSLRRLCQTLDSGGYYALARAPYPVDHGEGHIDRVMATVAALLEKIDFHAQLGVKKDRQSESVFELGVAIMVHDLAMAAVALHVAGGPQVQRSLHASIDRLEAYLKKAHVDAVVQGDNLLHAKLIAWAHAKDQSWSSAAKLAWMDQLSADFGCHYLRVWVRLLRLADLLDLGPRRVVNQLPSEISWQPDQLIHRDVHLYAEIAMEFPIIEIRSPMLGLHRMPVPNRDTIVKLNEIAQEIQSQIDEIRAWLPSLRLISTLPQIRLKQPQDRLKEIEESVREFLVENSGVGLDKVYAAVRGAAGHTRERGSSRRTHARRIRSNMDLPPEARARCDVLFERLKGIVRGFDRASLQYINRKGRRTLIYGIGINENVTSRWLLRPLSEDALIGEIFALKRTLIIEDTAQDTHGWKPNQDTKDVKSWICVPFISADGPCGLITLDHATPGHFSGADRDALDSFARQNGQLFEWIFSQYATARVARHSELIGDILGAMSEPIDSSVLLRTIVEQVALHLKCAHCTIFLAEPNGEKVSLVPKAACPEPDLANDRQFSLEEGGLAVRVFKTGEAEMHDDER